MFRKFLSFSAQVLTMSIIMSVVLMSIIMSVVLLFVGLVFLVLALICISWIATWIEIRGSMAERGTNGGRSMSIYDLEKLPCYDYIAKDNTSSPVDCAVCLENLTAGDKCRLLPMCNHSFHAQCVDTWLLKTTLCPICRSSADSSQSGSQVVGNNGYFIEPNSESSESQTTTGSQLDENRLQLRENPTLGSPNSSHREVELREHHTDTTESDDIC